MCYGMTDLPSRVHSLFFFETSFENAVKRDDQYFKRVSGAVEADSSAEIITVEFGSRGLPNGYH